MSHLVEYEQAVGPLAKARAALAVAGMKTARGNVEFWVDTAIEHAVEAGLDEDECWDLIEDPRYPNIAALRTRLEQQADAPQERSFRDPQNEYEWADGHVAKAIFCFLQVERETSTGGKWEWSRRGADHARITGIPDVEGLLGGVNLPKTGELLRRLGRLKEFDRQLTVGITDRAAAILAGEIGPDDGWIAEREAICRGE